MLKQYKNQQNQLKIANEQYKVSLKEINKSNKNPRNVSRSSSKDLQISQISEAICFDKQRKILENNMKNIQRNQFQLDGYAAEQSKIIFDELTEGIEFILLSQKSLFKSICQQLTHFNQSIKNELTNNIKNQSEVAIKSYQHALVFKFNNINGLKKAKREQDLNKSNPKSSKSDNFLYEDDNQEQDQEYYTTSQSSERSCIQLDRVHSQKQSLLHKSQEKRKSISSFQSPLNCKKQSQFQSNIKKSQSNSHLIQQSIKKEQYILENNPQTIDKTRNKSLSRKNSSALQKNHIAYSSIPRYQEQRSHYQNIQNVNESDNEEVKQQNNYNCSQEEIHYDQTQSEIQDEQAQIALYHISSSHFTTPQRKKNSLIFIHQPQIPTQQQGQIQQYLAQPNVYSFQDIQKQSLQLQKNQSPNQKMIDKPFHFIQQGFGYGIHNQYSNQQNSSIYRSRKSITPQKSERDHLQNSGFYDQNQYYQSNFSTRKNNQLRNENR